MTINEFNLKYKNYIVDGFYGLQIDDNKVIKFLDETIFPELILKEKFKFYSIKMKFGFCRFYADDITTPELDEIMEKINILINE